MAFVEQEFKLTSGYIELDNLLKAMGFVSCGAEAKEVIRKGGVLVNGDAEPRVRRKLKTGDRVQGDDFKILIT